jgi:hypothetical protein
MCCAFKRSSAEKNLRNKLDNKFFLTTTKDTKENKGCLNGQGHAKSFSSIIITSFGVKTGS